MVFFDCFYFKLKSGDLKNYGIGSENLASNHFFCKKNDCSCKSL